VQGDLDLDLVVDDSHFFQTNFVTRQIDAKKDSPVTNALQAKRVAWGAMPTAHLPLLPTAATMEATAVPWVSALVLGTTSLGQLASQSKRHRQSRVGVIALHCITQLAAVMQDGAQLS
jgi:hypothetical protein